MFNPYRLLTFTVLLTVGLDQGTKALALALLPPNEIVPLLDGYIDLRLRHNPGIGWGLGSGVPEATGRWLFPVLGVVVIGGLVVLYRRVVERGRLLRVGLALLVAGGVGNLIDRLRSGEVVDFVGVHVGGQAWTMSGTFNMADVAVVFGVSLMAVAVLRRGASSPEKDEGGES